MNVRCSFCQMPYTLSRTETLAALQRMDSEKLNHYDAHCPRCRRATPIPRARLEMLNPNWREAFKAMEAEMIAHPQQEAPLPAPRSAPVAETESTPAQNPAKEKPEVKTKPAPQVPAKEKPEAKTKRAAQKPAAQSKASVKKAATKKTK
jgi:hypothetical protein